MCKATGGLIDIYADMSGAIAGGACKTHRTNLNFGRTLRPHVVLLDPLIEELFPLFESISNSAKNIDVIGSVFLQAPELTLKKRYYGICILYLLHVEGIFDDSMRILYVLKKAADGQDVSLKKVLKKSLSGLRRQFRQMGAGLLFDGWNKHLRNAIAHAHFWYNDRTQKMSFQDIHPVTGKVVYDEDLNYKDFAEYYSKIDDVCSLMDHFFMLIRIRDLIFAPSVEV